MGVALLCARDDLVAHERAEPVGVGVGGVLAPERARSITNDRQLRLGAFAQVGAQLLASRLEQRSAHAAVAVAHRAEAAGAGAHNGTHIEALDAVIGGVRREDAPLGEGRGGAAAQLGERLVGGSVAFAPCDRLDIAALGCRDAPYVDRACEQGDGEQLGEPAYECLIGIGIRSAQPVVDVQDPKRPESAAFPQFSRQVRERRGVGSPRHHQQHRRLGAGKPPLDNATLHAFQNLHEPLSFTDTAARRPCRIIRRRRGRPCHLAVRPRPIIQR